MVPRAMSSPTPKGKVELGGGGDTKGGQETLMVGPQNGCRPFAARAGEGFKFRPQNGLYNTRSWGFKMDEPEAGF